MIGIDRREYCFVRENGQSLSFQVLWKSFQLFSDFREFEDSDLPETVFRPILPPVCR